MKLIIEKEELVKKITLLRERQGLLLKKRKKYFKDNSTEVVMRLCERLVTQEQREHKFQQT